jgi:hypothetical protein
LNKERRLLMVDEAPAAILAAHAHATVAEIMLADVEATEAVAEYDQAAR